MGRESRQARRNRERRRQEAQQSAARRGHSSGINRTQMIAGGVIVLAVIAVLVAMAFGKGSSTVNAQNAGTATAVAQFTPIAGLAAGPARCFYNEMTGAGFYHEHAHLTILNRGKDVPVAANIGFDTNRDCLYSVHTHSPSYGVIHIESPYKIVPTLGNFFHIWGQPLSRSQVASVKVGPGEQMKVYVDRKLYTGDPAAIKLPKHTLVTIEVGPPFKKPQGYAWNGL